MRTFARKAGKITGSILAIGIVVYINIKLLWAIFLVALAAWGLPMQGITTDLKVDVWTVSAWNGCSGSRSTHCNYTIRSNQTFQQLYINTYRMYGVGQAMYHTSWTSPFGAREEYWGPHPVELGESGWLARLIFGK